MAETPPPPATPAADAKPRRAPRSPGKAPAAAAGPAPTAPAKASPSGGTGARPNRPVPTAKPKEAAVSPPPKGTIVDATGLVLGRAASRIAKRLLEGESIIVVNAEKSVVTGSRTNVLAFYVANRARGSKRTGPHYPRYPDRIFRRTVRGMLPHLKTRGKEALDRLEVFIGVPPELGAHARQSIDEAHPTPALREPMTLEEITRLLGARL